MSCLCYSYKINKLDCRCSIFFVQGIKERLGKKCFLEGTPPLSYLFITSHPQWLGLSINRWGRSLNSPMLIHNTILYRFDVCLLHVVHVVHVCCLLKKCHLGNKTASYCIVSCEFVCVLDGISFMNFAETCHGPEVWLISRLKHVVTVIKSSDILVHASVPRSCIPLLVFSAHAFILAPVIGWHASIIFSIILRYALSVDLAVCLTTQLMRWQLPQCSCRSYTFLRPGYIYSKYPSYKV